MSVANLEKRVAELEAQLANARRDALDGERLDFVLKHQAFIVTTLPREPYGTLYQLWTQDEDEKFHIISGDGFFTSERAAIDRALAGKQ